MSYLPHLSGYVLLALVAKFALHEEVSPMRWIGIALISGGVGFVAGGPALTSHPDQKSGPGAAIEDVAAPALSSAEKIGIER